MHRFDTTVRFAFSQSMQKTDGRLPSFMSDFKQLFWLHIKKSAGMTIRSLLQPYYLEVDRYKNPKNFIQAKPEEYNDILNNYRVVLGEYQFKRCLFAQKYLYPEKWHEIYSFAFSREPTERCLSMFHYLFWRNSGVVGHFAQILSLAVSRKKFIFSISYAFDVFLDFVHKARFSNSIYHPISNHFTTHTAPMFDDITDSEGVILLSSIHRMEALTCGLNSAFEACGLRKRINNNDLKINANKSRRQHSPNQLQRKKIQMIYERDFEIYENAKH
jgi:hypothetical protein